MTESGVPYVYATGWAEQAGFASSFPFILAKYGTDGVRVGAVTELVGEVLRICDS